MDKATKISTEEKAARLRRRAERAEREKSPPRNAPAPQAEPAEVEILPATTPCQRATRASPANIEQQVPAQAPTLKELQDLLAASTQREQQLTALVNACMDKLKARESSSAPAPAPGPHTPKPKTRDAACASL